MTGNCKNSDWERRVSIKETKGDSLKICSDSLKTLLPTLDGRPIVGFFLCLRCLPMLLSFIGQLFLFTGRKFLKSIRNLTKCLCTTEKMLRGQAAEWKDITTKSHSTTQTWSKGRWELISSLNLLRLIPPGNKISGKSCS